MGRKRRHALSDDEKVVRQADRYIESARPDRAILLLRRESGRAADKGDRPVQANLLSKLALVQAHSGRSAEARETQRTVMRLLQNLDELEEVERQRSLATARNTLGYIERELGNLDAAIGHHLAALEAFRAINDRAGEGDALTNQGVALKDVGQLTEAKAVLDRAVALLDRHGTARQRGHAYATLGLLCELFHAWTEARLWYRKALRAYRRVPDAENEATVLHNLGALSDHQGKRRSALRYYGQAAAKNRAIGADAGHADDLAAIANAYMAMPRKRRAARGILERALPLQRRDSRRHSLVQTLCDLAYLDIDDGHVDRALERLHEALDLATAMGAPRQMYDVHMQVSDVYYLMYVHSDDGSVPAAIGGQRRGKRSPHVAEIRENILRALVHECAAAATVAESIRARLLSEDDAIGYFDGPQLEAYDRLVHLSMAHLDNPLQAWVWVERGKARELLRRLSLTETLHPTRLPDEPGELRARERDLLRQICPLARALSALDAAPQMEVLAAYDAAEKTLQAIWDEVEQYDPEYVALRRAEPPTFERVRACLRLESWS